jgi:enoyl-CoA hydratase/carnithine racemase
MEDVVQRQENGPVSVLTMQYGPYNLLGPTLIPAIADAVAAARDAGSRPIILCSGLRHFCAGADVAQSDPATLERWGLVNLVIADDALEEATMTVAQELAHGPTVAHAATKRLVHLAVNYGVLAADEATAEIQKPIWASEDLGIGLKSFHENGPSLARFTGR